MQKTDPEKDVRMRDLVVYTGDAMMEGSKLIHRMLITRQKQSNTDPLVELVHEDMSNLTDEARSALVRSLGSALLVSSFQLPFLGWAYRSALMLALNEDDREIK